MRTNLDRYRASMTEAEMQKGIGDALAARAARMWHIRRSDVAPETEDLPDLLILDPLASRVVLAELKSVRRNLTDGQAAVLELARQCHRFDSFTVRSVEPRTGEVSYDQFLEWLTGGM